MSFWTRLADAFKTRDTPMRLARALPDQDLKPSERLRPDQALNISTVWRCVTLIAESMANSPWLVYGPDATGKNVELENDPLWYLLNVRPSKDTTAQALREALVVQTMTSDWGSGYLEIVKDMAGRITELRLLMSDRVMMFRYGDPRAFAPVEWPQMPAPELGDMIYRYQELDGTFTWLREDQVFHLRGPSTNALFGDSLITRAAKAAAIAHAQDTFALSYYSRGAAPAGILKFDGILDNAQTRAEIKADFEANATGPINGRKPLVLEKGWDWMQVTGLNASESAVIPARQFSVDDIARFFGVPGALLNQNVQLPGQDLEGLGLIFVRYGLTSWKRRLEQEAAVKLISGKSKKFTMIDLEWLTHGNAKAIAETHRTYLETGVFNVNEVRQLLGYENLEDYGDLHLVKSGMVILDEDNLYTPQALAEETSESDAEGTEEEGGMDGGEAESGDTEDSGDASDGTETESTDMEEA